MPLFSIYHWKLWHMTRVTRKLNREIITFNKRCWGKQMPICRRANIMDSSFISFQNINSKWVRYVNVYKPLRIKCKTTSLWPCVCQCSLRYDTKSTSNKRKTRNGATAQSVSTSWKHEDLSLDPRTQSKQVRWLASKIPVLDAGMIGVGRGRFLELIGQPIGPTNEV